MRRHLDFLNFCECERRIEWRKCSIRESRTHCVPKFARKFFDKISMRMTAKGCFEKNFAGQRSAFFCRKAHAHALHRSANASARSLRGPRCAICYCKNAQSGGEQCSDKIFYLLPNISHVLGVKETRTLPDGQYSLETGLTYHRCSVG
jgi:hypothetical protein